MQADLFEEHRQMLATADALLAAVRTNPPVPLEEITQLRVRLGTLARAHLRNEDEQIMQPLLASGRIDEVPDAAAIMAEIRAGHSHYSNHVGKWTLQAVEADRAGYAVALVAMIDYLRTMTAREERLLYWPTLRMLRSMPSTDQSSETAV